jgi:tetratricopeptide (TPR) repeat protein
MWAVAAALFFLQATDFNAEGMKALDEGKYDAAVQSFSKAIAADPKDYFAHFNLGLAYGLLDRDAEGIAEYRKTLALQPRLYEAELNAGILLLRQKDPVEALPLLEDAAAQKPREFRPVYFLAEAQSQTGAAEKAIATYRLALELDSKSAGAELGLAHALVAQGNLADAAPHFRQAAQLEPKYRDRLLELANLYEQNRQTDEAAAIYREFPENPAAQQRLGELMMANKQYAEAIPRLEAAWSKEPSQANRTALAAAYVFTSQLEKALPLLQDAANAEPRDYDLRMMLARALRDRKAYPAAAAQFAEAARLKPAEPKTWNELGGMLYLTGSYPQALAAFDRARDLGENSPGNWFLRAIILDKLKQSKPALDAYQHFVSMSQGKNPDQEFQARQRIRILKRELEKR